MAVADGLINWTAPRKWRARPHLSRQLLAIAQQREKPIFQEGRSRRLLVSYGLKVRDDPSNPRS